MADADSSSSPSFFRRQWEERKEFFGKKCSFLDNYKKYVRNRENPMPSWSDSDIEEFIASDPTHGPTLKTAREAFKFSAAGSAIGAISTAGVSWKYSRSPHGAILSLGAGAVFGWAFGHEIANHWLQLYRMDTMAAQGKFLDWWTKKSEGQS